ncbi:helix-turn-helix transcriptional regulator [Methylococcus geothermalis]|uniref:AlpA family phage regulatory protein n=1 Tax=Methylococcus geothermalis TaxID=2681310 RepID=A0A858Q8F4_9GAMM|nr:AlpA family phage regulatory protein [Methylococcus geothermalis]QJD30182.1 AlpA family phage regulatory protein [Methylococcus geothermalis]
MYFQTFPRPTSETHFGVIPRYLRLPGLRARYGVSQATVWRWCQIGLLPPPIKLAAKTSCWVLAELDRVDEAREAGATAPEIKALVKKIVADRRAPA